MATNKLLKVLLAAACVGVVGAAVSSGLSRKNLGAVEKSSNEVLADAFGDRSALVGDTRSVYLPGYGIVFSAEMDVAPGATPNPFKQSFSREEIARIKETKRQRLDVLRRRMQRLMVGYADSVQVGDGENIAMAVTLLYSKIEDTDGMPRQIVMWAPRGALRSGNAQAIAGTLKVQESF